MDDPYTNDYTQWDVQRVMVVDDLGRRVKFGKWKGFSCNGLELLDLLVTDLGRFVYLLVLDKCTRPFESMLLFEGLVGSRKVVSINFKVLGTGHFYGVDLCKAIRNGRMQRRNRGKPWEVHITVIGEPEFWRDDNYDTPFRRPRATTGATN